MPVSLPPLSRRSFLGRSLAGGAAVLLSRRLFGAERQFDPHCWALLSDPHIAADPMKTARGINMTDQFARVVQEVLSVTPAPAGALINGDLAFNTGETPDYTTFNELITPLRTAGLPLHLMLGNHDHRERFWEALRDDASARRAVADRHVAVVATPRANWFLLDSLDQTNSTPGKVGEAQLRWLAETLDAKRDRPALIVMHHNPRLAPDKVSILDEDAFYDVIRPRRHVKAFVFGHSHRWNVEQDPSGLHLINLPTTAYIFEPGRPVGWVLAQLERNALRLELRCLDPQRPDHRQQLELAYRT